MRFAPIQDQVAALHREDCNRSKADIARMIGCSDKYVGICFRRLGIGVGFPAPTPEERSRKSLHPTGWRESIARPITFVKPKPPPNQHCLKLTYFNGGLHRCNAPTGGHDHCPSCERKLITMFDPVIPTRPASTAEAA
jgi:hypothetical protein